MFWKDLQVAEWEGFVKWQKNDVTGAKVVRAKGDQGAHPWKMVLKWGLKVRFESAIILKITQNLAL